MQMRNQLDILPKYAFYMDGMATLMRNTMEVLYLSGEPVELKDVIEFLSTLPQYPSQLATDAWKGKECCKRLKTAYEGGQSDKRVKELADYFFAYYPQLSNFAKDMLHDGAIGVLIGMRDAAAVERMNGSLLAKLFRKQ